MLTRKRRIALLFILFNLIYIVVTLFFMKGGYQLPGILDFLWIMLGGIGGAWLIDAYKQTQNNS
jgi:hypothetical protein